MPVRSERAAVVAQWFDLSHPHAAATPPAPRPPHAPPQPGQVLLVTGPSGSGKSTLLRAMRAAADATDVRWVDLADVAVDEAVPIVDTFRDLDLCATLAVLARVGLGEAWTYLRTAAELSDGQRWRLRLAHALHAAGRLRGGGDGRRTVLVCDEFAALLDRVTAAVVAHALRKVAGDGGMAVVVATSHEDLAGALAPDEVVQCDFEEGSGTEITEGTEGTERKEEG